MNKIQKEFEKIKKSGKPGLMTHVVTGCPNLETSEQIIYKMAENGVNFIEIQLPFSDPVADGAVMMEANEIALKNKITVNDSFELAKKVSKKIDIPLFFMGYYNLIFKIGVFDFCKKAKEVGISGLIFPDLPFDEAKIENFFEACNKYNLSAIQVVSKITSSKRLNEIAKIANGFIYCQARYGTTGVENGNHLSENLEMFLERVSAICKLPIAVGFGISSKKDILNATKKADVVVVGSAIMKIAIDKKLTDKQKLENIGSFLQTL